MILRSPVRNVAKAVLADQRHSSRLRVNFDSPTGGRCGNFVRNIAHPVIHSNGLVSVQAFKGLWVLRASLIPHTNYDGTPLRNAGGRCYKAHVRFDAVHVLWIDETPTGRLTPDQRDDAVKLYAFRTRTTA